MARYPIGIQTFETIIEGGYLYVDKTGYIPKLLNYSYVFMARPRRFGKSLLLSTLQCYFSGRKELFKGLEISKTEKEWRRHPVIMLSFAAFSGPNAKKLEDILLYSLHQTAKEYGVNITQNSPELAFSELISLLREKTGEKVVILIDEYDKGLVETIHDEELLRQTEDVLRPFYAILKDQDRNIRFAMLTGVARFRHLTIFSGSNNIHDISFEKQFAGICGITQPELEATFEEGIDNLCVSQHLDRLATLRALKETYDGYRFTAVEEYVYNPFSLLNSLAEGELKPYWARTGTSRVFVDMLKKANFKLEDLLGVSSTEEELSSAYSSDNPVPLMFQTGYLTIRRSNGYIFTLDIPNREVQTALVEVLLPAYLSLSADKRMPMVTGRLQHAMSIGDIDSAMKDIRSILSSIPYQIIDSGHLEAHFHLCMSVVMLLCGVAAHCERAISSGRIDMVAYTSRYVYVIEFKLDQNAEVALHQINDREYALPWHADERKVIKVGVSFSSKTRNIDSWVVEK